MAKGPTPARMLPQFCASRDDAPGPRRPGGTGNPRRARAFGPRHHRDLRGQRVGAAHAVDLARVGRAHDRAAGRRRARRCPRAGPRPGSSRPWTCRRASTCSGCPVRHTSAPSRPAARACRRCRAPARPPPAARACPPRSPAAPGLRQHLLGLFARHHADPVVIGHDDVAGRGSRPGADDGHVDRPERLLDRALRGDRAWTRPGSPSRAGRAMSRTPRVDHQPAAAARHGGGREKVAEIAHVAGRGRGQHQDVALGQLLDGDMDHPVVARRGEIVTADAGDGRALLIGPHPGGHAARLRPCASCTVATPAVPRRGRPRASARSMR